jgi:microsomal dipeptidase-like Zn-dependent dipeptidase
MSETSCRIDALQYANWSEKIFEQMRAGGVDAVHVTIAYHENFRETVANMEQWNSYFERFPQLIFQGFSGDDVRLARDTGRTAIFFGFQNPSPMEDDIRLIEILHTLGVRFMQLTYNNQSLLATGCYESEDSGVTRMGREVIAEMNRVGLVVDMSHSAERSTLDAIEISERPIVVTHANPAFWHPALRNKSDAILKGLGETGGMLGFSMYPHHLKDGGNCSLQSFCQMIADCAEIMGVDHIGLGSDLAGPRKLITARVPPAMRVFRPCPNGSRTIAISAILKRDCSKSDLVQPTRRRLWATTGCVSSMKISVGITR